MSLRRNFTWMLTSKAALMVGGVVTASLINRALGPSGRGVLAEMQTWATFFIVVFGISIDAATYHFANRVVYGDDDNSRFVTIFLLNFIYALLATIALTFFVFYWPGRVSSKMIELLFLVDIFLIISMLAANLTIFFQALGNIRFSALIGVTKAVIYVGIIGVAYFLKGINIRFVIVAMIIVQAVVLSMILWISFKKGFMRGRFSKGMAAGLIKAGFKQHIATVSAFVYIKINQLIVFRYCGESEAGIFAVSLNLALILTLIPEVFQTVLYPRVIHSDDDYDITLKSLRLAFYGCGGIALLTILFARPMLLIYAGKAFLPSVTVFRVIMVGVWFLSVSSFFAPYFIKVGAFAMSSFLTVLLAIISIGLNLFLVPRYASIGAASATTLSCFTGFCMLLVFIWYLTKKNPFLMFKISPVDLGFLKYHGKNRIL